MLSEVLPLVKESMNETKDWQAFNTNNLGKIGEGIHFNVVNTTLRKEGFIAEKLLEKDWRGINWNDGNAHLITCQLNCGFEPHKWVRNNEFVWHEDSCQQHEFYGIEPIAGQENTAHSVVVRNGRLFCNNLKQKDEKKCSPLMQQNAFHGEKSQRMGNAKSQQKTKWLT